MFRTGSPIHFSEEPLFLFSAALAGMPTVVLADCGPAPSNGFGANYASYAAWCTQCGGRPYNDRGVGCDMSGASSGGQSYQAPQVGGVQGAVLKGIQQGIQQGIQNAIKQRQQIEAEQIQRQQMENDRASQKMIQDSAEIDKDTRDKARLIEEKKRISAMKTKQSDGQRADDILSQMRGGFETGPGSQPVEEAQGSSLYLKDVSKRPDSDAGKCVGKEDFTEYRKRESERREILGKLAGYSMNNQGMKERADWCKMHIPLPPVLILLNIASKSLFMNPE